MIEPVREADELPDGAASGLSAGLGGVKKLGEMLDSYIAAGEKIYGKGYYQRSMKRQEEIDALLGVGEDETTVDAILRVCAERDRYRAALEKLARLGNEPHYGNSVGNRIAQESLGIEVGLDA